MKITLLGTGTSFGVPVIGCKCEVCTSTDVHDRRMRTSALIEADNTCVLIDCGPDFREQLLPLPIDHIDAVLITHEHYDHTGGLDDLRPFCQHTEIPLYGQEKYLRHIQDRIPYCFDNPHRGIPHLRAEYVKPYVPFRVGSLTIVPLIVMHGKNPILGFRIGNFAYITDMKTLPTASEPYLDGLECMVINGLGKHTHPTHETVEEAVKIIHHFNVPRAYLTHMSHDAGLHRNSPQILPPHVHYAYDGQVIEV